VNLKSCEVSGYSGLEFTVNEFCDMNSITGITRALALGHKYNIR